MSREVWLRTNRRLLVGVATVPLILLVCALVALPRARSSMAFWSLAVLAGISAGSLVYIALRARRPRLAYENGQLAVYLFGRRPLRVPIEFVECFFLGQGPSRLPTLSRGDREMETATLVVRLAESAHDWKHRDVRPWLGQWCEGYITIRGTFCEPLSSDVAGRLNRRLVETHRQLKQTMAKEKA